MPAEPFREPGSVESDDEDGHHAFERKEGITIRGQSHFLPVAQM